MRDITLYVAERLK